MSAFEFALILPEDMPSYLAILGLLFCWKLHEVEDQLGRIKTEDVRDVLRRLALARPIFKRQRDRKSTRLNSSHGYISYAVFCLKKKKTQKNIHANIHNKSDTHTTS